MHTYRLSSSSVVEHPTRSRRVVGSNPIWDSDFFRVYVSIRMLCGQPVFLIPKSRRSQIRFNSVLSSPYYRFEIFDFQAMIKPILEIAIQKSALGILKSEFRNQKSETRNQKSQIEIPENLKSTTEKSEFTSLISEMPLVIFNSDNHGLSLFAMSLFRISNR